MMKLCLATIALFLTCSSLFAEPPADPVIPAVPAVLEPLNAKIGRYWAFKGTVLSFRAEKPVTDEQWKAIEGLGIKLIATGGKGIDDAAIARMVVLDPERLSLDGAEMTDDGFQSLAKMKSLRQLGVGHNAFGNKAFTGSGFALLKDLPHLEILNFGGTSTGPEALAAIGELTQLKELNSWHTQTTDAQNLFLLKLTNLTELTWGNSLPNGKARQLGLDDSTLDTIAQMKSLTSLWLMQAHLTLPAVEKLKALPNLKTLKFENVDLSPADIEKLRAELPGVTITYKPLTEEDIKKLNDFLK